MADLQVPKYQADAQRNILIIGTTGAGKASIANAILGTNLFPVGSAIQSTTRKSNIAFKNYQAEDDYDYNIATVDTVDVADNPKGRNIKKKIQRALNNFTSLNLIILVFKNERFTPQEQGSFTEAITTLSELVPNASTITVLVVTYCEQKDDQARDEIKKELGKQGAPTASIEDFAQIGTYLVGLPKLSDVAPPLKKFIEQRLYSDEQTLQELVRKASATKEVNAPELDSCLPVVPCVTI